MAETDLYDDEELSGTKEESFIEEVRTRFSMARDHWRDWRDEARKCFEFYNGHQWSDDDIEYLQSQLRVPITFNRVQPYIDAVLGHETNNRQELKYIPRTQGDAAVNEVVTQVAQFYTDQCDGEYADSEAFKHMLICGIGWTETRLDDTENPDYDLVRECVSPLHILPDPTSERPCFGDARYVFKVTQHSKTEVKYMFPEWDGDSDGNEWDFYGDDDDKEDDGELLGPRDSYLSNDGETNDTAGRDITVVQYQYKDYEDVWMGRDPQSGSEKPIPDELYENPEFKAELQMNGIEVRKKKRVVCKVAYIVGSQVLKHAVICKNDFTLQGVTGKRDVSHKVWHGIMRSLMDVQQWSNKFLSQMLHIINSQAKGGLDIEESAVADIDQFEAKYAQPGALLVYRDGALQNNRVKERSSVQFPAQFERLLQYANSSFGDVAGINSELLGMADREQPGVLEYQRRQSAVSLLAPLFDSLRLYRKRMGRVWLYFIQKYLADGRIARITIDPEQLQAMQAMQQPGQQPMPDMQGSKSRFVSIAVNPQLIGDPETARFDIIVDQAANAPNQKEATWAVLTQLGPFLKDVITPPVLMKMLEYSPLPASLMEELKLITAQQAQNKQPSPEEMKMQMEAQFKQQEVQFKQQELDLKRQEAEAEINLERQKMMATIELERAKAQLKAEIDIEKFERQSKIDDMKFDREQSMAEQKLKSDVSLQLARQALEPNENGEVDEMRLKNLFNGDEQLAQAMVEMSNSIREMAQSNQQSNQMMAQAINSMGEQIKEAMERPKQIVRGPDGRAIGVQ